MGNTQSMRKINFEDMQTVTKNPEIYLLINTLPLCDQQCLIRGTVSSDQEENAINKYLKENKNVFYFWQLFLKAPAQSPHRPTFLFLSLYIFFKESKR